MADMEHKTYVLPLYTYSPNRLTVHEQVVELHNCIYGCREEKCTVTDYTCCSFYNYFLVC